MGSEHGPRKVLGEAVVAAGEALADERRAADGEQLDLMPAPTRFMGARAEHLQRALEHRNRAGRPPGAVSKSTKELREYLLKRGVHPLQRMMEWMQHTPTSLAAELGCTRLEAYDRLARLWEAATPYFAAKLVPTDDQGKPMPFFNLVIGGQHAHMAPGDGAAPWLNPETGGPWGAVEESQQNQALPAPSPNVSHAQMSHDDED